MDPDLHYPLSHAAEGIRPPVSTRSHYKGAYPEFLSDFNAWEVNVLSETSSFNPNLSSKSPVQGKNKKNEISQLMPLKNLSRIKRKIQSSLPEIVSAYEISKVHPRYKEFFDQPLKSFREKEKYPAINNKSLLSVYLPNNVDKKVVSKSVNFKAFEGIVKREKRKGMKGRETLEPIGKLLTIYNNFK